MSRPALLRLLPHRALLARAVAELIAVAGIAEGNRAFDADEDAPDAVDLFGQIARAQWERREQQAQIAWAQAIAYDAEADAETKAFFAAMRAQREAAEAAAAAEQAAAAAAAEPDDASPPAADPAAQEAAP